MWPDQKDEFIKSPKFFFKLYYKVRPMYPNLFIFHTNVVEMGVNKLLIMISNPHL